jgi:hypothetical protein
MVVVDKSLAGSPCLRSPADDTGSRTPESESLSGIGTDGQFMRPLERKAAFKAAVTLARMSAANAARQLGVSYNHLMLVLNGDRVGSERLRHAIAAFLGCTAVEVFGSRAQRVAPEPQRSTER